MNKQLWSTGVRYRQVNSQRPGEKIVPTSLCEFPHGKGKGKVHPCTGTEALYRPYGP